jgi:hypothetical protein
MRGIGLCALLLAALTARGWGELSVQVLMTSDAKHAPSPEHVAALIRDTAAQLGLGGEELPHMVLVYAAPGSASLHHLPADTKQFLQKVETPDGPIFEIWIMGTTADEFSIFGIGAALNQRFELGFNTERLKQLTAVVCRRRKQTVTVESLRSTR